MTDVDISKDIWIHSNLNEEICIHHIHMGISYILFSYKTRCTTRISHFLPPTIPCPEVPDKLGDELLVILSLASALPRTFRSSNSLYEGIKGFCAVVETGFPGPELAGGSPCITEPLLPLMGNELFGCKGL